MLIFLHISSQRSLAESLLLIGFSSILSLFRRFALLRDANSQVDYVQWKSEVCSFSFRASAELNRVLVSVMGQKSLRKRLYRRPNRPGGLQSGVSMILGVIY